VPIKQRHGRRVMDTSLKPPNSQRHDAAGSLIHVNTGAGARAVRSLRHNTPLPAASKRTSTWSCCCARTLTSRWMMPLSCMYSRPDSTCTKMGRVSASVSRFRALTWEHRLPLRAARTKRQEQQAQRRLGCVHDQSCVCVTSGDEMFPPPAFAKTGLWAAGEQAWGRRRHDSAVLWPQVRQRTRPQTP
jgi:hypothetical protein